MMARAPCGTLTLNRFTSRGRDGGDQEVYSEVDWSFPGLLAKHS